MISRRMLYVIFVVVGLVLLFVIVPTDFDETASSITMIPTLRPEDVMLQQLQQIGKRCGYKNVVYNPETKAYEIAKYKIQNELFLLSTGLHNHNQQHSLVQSINNVLFPLDDAIHHHLSRMRNKKRPGKPGTGRTGRGW
eukprot:PhF_6_TR31545/c0_g1_i3/m.46550